MKEYNLTDIIKENTSLKNMHTYIKNNIYLSENQITVLKQYQIDYDKYFF